MTDLLSALLGEGGIPAEAWRDVDAAAFVRAAERQGVLSLVARCAGRADGVPADVAAAIADRSRSEAARDMAREHLTTSVLRAMADARVPALVFKGTQLAYTHYQRPDHRPRLDVDLLVPDTDREAAAGVLERLDYRPEVQAGAAGVLYQRAYVGPRGVASPLVIDLHWAIANPTVFRHVLSFDELDAEAVGMPELGPTARGPGAVHALVIAACHRVAHHPGDDRLIWIYDIDLLSRSLTAADWRRFARLAVARGVREVCAASLERSRVAFATPIPGDLWDGEAIGRETPEKEVTAAYLDPGRPHALVVLDDLRALSTWRARARVIRSHTFPPTRYMREVYAPSSRAPLAWLYASRLARGALRWSRRRGGADQP